MNNESASAAGEKKGVKRLNKVGQQILQDYLAKNAGYPSLKDRKALLAQIRKIPGLESYPLINVNNWFIRHRANDLTPATASASASSKSTPALPKATPPKAIPSSKPSALNAEQIQYLSVLSEGITNATEKQIALWSGIVKAPSQDVEAWLKDNRSSHSPIPPPPAVVSSQTPVPPPPPPASSRTPIPPPIVATSFSLNSSNTLSATPSTAPSAPQQMRVPSHPIAPLPKRKPSGLPANVSSSSMKVDTPQPVSPIKATSLTLTKSAMGIIPPQPVTYPQAAPPAPVIPRTHPRSTLQTELLRSIAEMSLTPTDAPVAKSASEFNAILASYDDKMKTILEKLS